VCPESAGRRVRQPDAARHVSDEASQEVDAPEVEGAEGAERERERERETCGLIRCRCGVTGGQRSAGSGDRQFDPGPPCIAPHSCVYGVRLSAK